ncbi:hypothetical protein, partial [Photorhabdus bodei]|uniref:hypothetical protein n=1 Tax=Photorhabdus bodei TaxID=2029681 RepID=UPI003BB53819
INEPESQKGKCEYDWRKSGSNEGKSGSSLPQVGVKSGSPKPAASRSSQGLNDSQVWADRKALFRPPKNQAIVPS